MREIIRKIGGGRSTIQRTLASLTESGIITSERRGRQTYYMANPDCPIYNELLSIITKTVGIADILREALSKEKGIKTAFIYGSFAKGKPKPDSDVDVMIIGDITFGEVSRLLDVPQRKLGREINPTVYSINEFQERVKAKTILLLRFWMDQEFS